MDPAVNAKEGSGVNLRLLDGGRGFSVRIDSLVRVCEGYKDVRLEVNVMQQHMTGEY